MSNHYTEIPSSVGLQWELLPDYDVHKQISARGISFLSPQEIELASILSMDIKLVSLTGSIEFLVKVLKVIPIEGEPLFEIHANFYDTDGTKEDEVLSLIRSIQ